MQNSSASSPAPAPAKGLKTATWMSQEPRVHVLDMDLHAITMDRALELVHRAIVERAELRIGVVNAAKALNMARDEELRADVLSSDMLLADGMSLVWASHVLRAPLPERVAGIDIMMQVLARGNQEGYRVFCLGATDEVLNTVCKYIARDYPNVKVVGARNGYFDLHKDGEAVAAEIAAAGADVLFVAITSPKKERFMARWGRELGIPVIHGVGGSFDVYAGKVLRAPESWQRLGLEWFYRLKQEPRRLWKRYLVTNTGFCLLVFRHWLRSLAVSGTKTSLAGKDAARR